MVPKSILETHSIKLASVIIFNFDTWFLLQLYKVSPFFLSGGSANRTRRPAGAHVSGNIDSAQRILENSVKRLVVPRCQQQFQSISFHHFSPGLAAARSFDLLNLELSEKNASFYLTAALHCMFFVMTPDVCM